MSELQGVVGRLAAAIADGERVEWASVDSLAKSAKDQALIEQLRAISRVERRAGLREPNTLGADTAPMSALWLVLYAIAIAQILIAVAFSLGAGVAVIRPAAPQIIFCLSFAAAALALLQGGRRDPRARHLGQAYLLMAAAFAQSFVRSAAQEIPLAGLFRGLYPESFVPVAAWRFADSFPRLTRFTRFDRVSGAFMTISVAVGVAFFADNLLLVRWTALRSIAPWLSLLERNTAPGDLALPFWLPILGLMFAAVVFSCWRAIVSEGEERLRAFWFLTALGFGSLPMFVLAALRTLSPGVREATTTGSLATVAFAVGATAIISVPFTTAYAVLVHRVLNVRLVLHQTTRYLLAKYTLTALMVLPVLIPFRLAYLHQDWRVDDVLRDPETALAGWLALTGAVLLALRGRLVGVLDRVLLGTHLDYSSALVGTAAAIGRGRTAREIAFEASNCIRQALGVSQIAVLLRARAGSFRALYGTAPDMPNETSLLAILAETPAVMLNRDEPLFDMLPPPDRDWLTRGDFEVVARVPSPDGDIAGVVGIGPRRGGLPFSKADLAFIGAVMATSGVALSRHPFEDAAGGAGDGDLGAVECERCGSVGGSLTCGCHASSRPARLPALLSGKFAVSRRLGSGGMGVVYLGCDVSLDRKVALKTLPEVSRAAATAMFAEARTMAQVEHPNVAMIYALETWQNTPVLVVEYLAGGTLADRLTSGPMPVADALRIAAAVADGLAALHATGILHRDIKPTNIGFTRAGVPKLLDFGVARLLAHASSDGTPARASRAGTGLLSNTAVAGTPLYLSPEALNGAPPDAFTDLWSAGVVLLEMIAGEYPFAGRSRADAIARVAAGEPDWQAVRRRLPPELVVVCDRLLSRDTSRRIQTPMELAATLRSSISHFS